MIYLYHLRKIISLVKPFGICCTCLKCKAVLPVVLIKMLVNYVSSSCDPYNVHVNLAGHLTHQIRILVSYRYSFYEVTYVGTNDRSLTQIYFVMFFYVSYQVDQYYYVNVSHSLYLQCFYGVTPSSTI